MLANYESQLDCELRAISRIRVIELLRKSPTNISAIDSVPTCGAITEEEIGSRRESSSINNGSESSSTQNCDNRMGSISGSSDHVGLTSIDCCIASEVGLRSTVVDVDRTSIEQLTAGTGKTHVRKREDANGTGNVSSDVFGPTFLNNSEILNLVKPLTQPAAICRALDKLGFSYIKSPNGLPVVRRPGPVVNSTKNSVPDRSALIAKINGRR